MLDDLKRGRCWHLGKLRLSETNRNSYKELLVRKIEFDRGEKCSIFCSASFYWKRVFLLSTSIVNRFFKTHVKRVLSVRLQTVLFRLVTDPLSRRQESFSKTLQDFLSTRPEKSVVLHLRIVKMLPSFVISITQCIENIWSSN